MPFVVALNLKSDYKKKNKIDRLKEDVEFLKILPQATLDTIFNDKMNKEISLYYNGGLNE